MSTVFRQGDHICALYETEDEQLAIATEYLADGLRRGERCFYVAASRAALSRFRAALIAIGIDAQAMVKRRALIEATNAEAHLVDGRFDTERMLVLLNEAVEAALNAGFVGLRTCGDMSWLLEEASGSEQVVEYEGLLNEFFHRLCAAGMCQYDRRRLPPHLIDHALATHPSVAFEGRFRTNPHYRPYPRSSRRRSRPDLLKQKLTELRQA